MSDSDKDTAAEGAATDQGPPAKAKKPSLKERLAELGSTGLVVYFIIFIVTVAGFAIAISVGFEVESTGSGTGVLLAAWVATKLTQPLRIGATFVLTPIVVAALHKIRPPIAPPENDAVDEDAGPAEKDGAGKDGDATP